MASAPLLRRTALAGGRRLQRETKVSGGEREGTLAPEVHRPGSSWRGQSRQGRAPVRGGLRSSAWRIPIRVLGGALAGGASALASGGGPGDVGAAPGRLPRLSGDSLCCRA